MRGLWTHAAALAMALACAAAAAADRDEVAWAFDAAEPGADRPPVGRSLFDGLVVTDRGTAYEVPFPFSALRERILRHLGGDGSIRPKETLIPLGRALQRRAAAPDFFRYPRLVLAVDADPGTGGGPLLRDRLFIAYQDKAESLEVISYNPAAGRFEFQVVKDYAPGKTPRVVYANRRLCLSCHQNGAPIFSEPLWSETNGNPEIGRRLLREARSFHGVPAYSGPQAVAQPFAIAEAAERANLLAAYQQVWRKGCGEGPSSDAAIACRAALLTAALQVKLSGGGHFDAASDLYRKDLAGPLKSAWRRHWPRGLAIPDPRIPDRDPLITGEGVTGEGVTAALDPLRTRPPLETWSVEEPGTIGRVIEGLSQFISNGDARRLDARLFALGQDRAVARSTRTYPCAVSRRTIEGWRQRILFRCEPPEAGDVSVTGYFYLEAGGRIAGEIPRFKIAEGVVFEELAVSAAGPAAPAGRPPVLLQPLGKRTGLHPRMPDGSAVESLALHWDAIIEEDFGPSDEMPVYPDNGRIVVTFVHDFAPVHEAVAALARAARAGEEDLFSDRPFRRAAVMGALFRRLGIAAGDGCCVDDRGMPPIAVEDPPAAVPIPDGGPAAALHAFDAYCGTCHDTPEAFPPNFLRGDAGARRLGIAQCGARIAFRLAMWDQPEEVRAKTPMPPSSWLRSAGIGPRYWRASLDLARLRAHVEPDIAAGGEPGPAPGAHAYDDLRPCLAAPD